MTTETPLPAPAPPASTDVPPPSGDSSAAAPAEVSAASAIAPPVPAPAPPAPDTRFTHQPASPALTGAPTDAPTAVPVGARTRPSQPPLPAPTVGDVLFALALAALGFCFWDWGLPTYGGAGIGTTLFFLLALLMTLVYLRVRGIRQNAWSLLLFAAALAAALPFALYGYRSINVLLLPFEAMLCLLWLAYSCRTLLASAFSGLIVGDWLNQALIVPFANFGSFFTWPARRAGSRRALWLRLLLALAGIIICIPVLGIVIGLLSMSDEGFRSFIESVAKRLYLGDVARYVFEFAFGLPIAAYVFGAVVGNVFHRRSALLSADGMRRVFSGAHALPRALFIAPLALFAALYVTYFIAMGSYLFSGLQSELPAAYTYAQYARRGFFELCGVATINLVLLAGVWLLAKRGAREHPLSLRLLTGLLSLLTCLLIVTAASKMLLYIGSYGLTPLRVYTTWFMALLLLAFSVLVAWHVRPFNAVRPLVILTIVAVLALGLTNTTGLVAGHNVQRYLDGRVTAISLSTADPDVADPDAAGLDPADPDAADPDAAGLDPADPDPADPDAAQGEGVSADELDIMYLAQLGDAALPALYELHDRADDAEAVRAASDIIEWNYRAHTPESDGTTLSWQDESPEGLPSYDWQQSISWSYWGWPNMNLQSYQALRLHG